MPADDRYSIERLNGSWIVVDKARNGTPVGRAGDEDGARVIMALLDRIGGSSRPTQEGGGARVSTEARRPPLDAIGATSAENPSEPSRSDERPDGAAELLPTSP